MKTGGSPTLKAGERPARAVQHRLVTTRRPDGRFVNPEDPRAKPGSEAGAEPSLREFLKWRHQRAPPPREVDVPRVDPPPARLPAPPARGLAATWVGHSSVVLQLDGRTYLCDPVWSERIGVVIRRRTPPGVPWSALPRVDALLVSHNHYDHLDAPTVRRLPRDTPVLCGLGMGAWFRRRGFARVEEMGWWDEAKLEGHRVAYVPAQHFSGRTLRDRDRTLWGGFVVEGSGGSKAWFAGDSGYFSGFREIGDTFPGLHLAMVPIGAYAPRWFMAPVHVDPAEAGQAFLDSGARWMLPLHWGTFRLADEAVDEPPRVLRAWWREKGLDPERLKLPALGETVRLDP